MAKHDQQQKPAAAQPSGTETEADASKKFEELEHKYKRALADYQNLLKQTVRDREEFRKFAGERFLHELLPVYDNLKMSFAHAGEEAAANGWLKGIEHIIRQFGEALAGMGVIEIKTAGEPFDYHTMEAIEKVPTEEAEKDGLVERELKSGYILHGKVIAPARVAVWEYKIKM